MRKGMLKPSIISLILAILGCINVSAHRYDGTYYTFSQPNGDSVTVKLYGDDYFIQAESVDGYTLIQDADDGYICYALLSSDSTEYASSGIRYSGGETPQAVKMIASPHLCISSKSIAKKQEKTKATLGIHDKLDKPVLRSGTTVPDTIYGVTILIDFPDCKFPFTIDELDQFLNGEESINGNSMSIKEYFRWISNGKLTYINYLPKKPFTAPNEKSYYAPEDATSYTFNRLKPVVLEAFNGFTKEKDGFDLNDLSYNGTSYYAVNILYAGKCPNKWNTGLWAHQGEMSIDVVSEQTLGYTIYKTIRQPYQLSYCSTDLSMGTFVHESFHLLLDAPDFYSFDKHTGNTAEPFNVADEFSVRNPKNPPIPNPWILDHAGWLDNKIVLNDLADGTTVNLEYGPGNVAVYYGNVDGDPMKERYYLEVRNYYYYNKRAVNTPGIYIWHVYEPGDNRYEKYTDKLDCRPASSLNPFWSQSSPSKVFSDNSEPSAKWNNGDPSGLYLCNFSKAASTMSFCYGECEPEEDQDEEDDGNVEDRDTIQSYEKLDLTNRDSLPNGRVGESYYAKLNPVGGDGKYSIQWKDGLPAGLNLNSDFEIVGVPEISCNKYLKMLVCDGTGAQTEVWLKLSILDVATSSAISLLREHGISIVNANGAFAISCQYEKIHCDIYTIGGTKMDEITIEAGEIGEFGSSYPKGIYLVNVKGKLFKIVK